MAAIGHRGMTGGSQRCAAPAETGPSSNATWRINMKMVKSLLLGSAAGVVAVAGAQAADLPVKAEPVQYVKICTLYGDGFYYIPGSDTCIRFSGYIRADYGYNVTGARTAALHGCAPARRTAPSATTRPGIVAASRSTPARRPPTARCGRSRPATSQNENEGTNRPTSPRVHPVGRLHLRPDGVVHRPRRQPRQLRHALAAPDAEPERRPAPTAPTRSPTPGSSATASP